MKRLIRVLAFSILAASLVGCRPSAAARGVTRRPGPGGADIFVLSNRHGVAEVSLYGAQIRRYDPVGQAPVLFAPTGPVEIVDEGNGRSR